MELSLPYIIKKPKIKSDKNPLILLLHGYGSNEEDLFSFSDELSEDAYIVSAQAPYSLQGVGFAWYAINFDAEQNKFSDNNQAIKSRDLIVKFINELVNNYPINSRDVTLIGFSQGAILSYAVALSFPEKIQKVVALSGYLNLEILAENYKSNNFENLKFFISHGTMDNIVPVEWARKTPIVLKELNIENSYNEYPSAHGISPKNFDDFRNWLK